MVSSLGDHVWCLDLTSCS
uniref:Uncharacterized protein n=1 Tax=Rhizophora mucronata TaxID=61149 RepID=A0A2P2P6B9_RHIMU